MIEKTIRIPPSNDGLTEMACPNQRCAPGYFKVKGGTGILGQGFAFCPYCRTKGKPNDFVTAEQMRYVKDIAVREAQQVIDDTIRKVFELDSSGRRSYGRGGMFSLEVSYKPDRLPSVRNPLSEELRRDVMCPQCTLHQAVFGLATWCSDCGRDIFMTHVAAEFDVVRAMVGDVPRRRSLFGARVATKDLENALEDTVSIFEAVLRVLVRRKLIESGQTNDDIAAVFQKKIRNGFQNVVSAKRIVRELLGLELFDGWDDNEVERLRLTFAKRHPITHNLGIVDREYLEKARTGELDGRDVRVTAPEMIASMDAAFRAAASLHARLFASALAS